MGKPFYGTPGINFYWTFGTSVRRSSRSWTNILDYLRPPASILRSAGAQWTAMCVGGCVSAWSIFKTTLLLVRIHHRCRCRWRDGNIARLYRFRFPHSALLLVRRTAPILPWSSRRHKLEGYPTAEPVNSKLSYGRDRDQGHQQPSRGWTSQHHGIH